jgi:hypothetical protein
VAACVPRSGVLLNFRRLIGKTSLPTSLFSLHDAIYTYCFSSPHICCLLITVLNFRDHIYALST